MDENFSDLERALGCLSEKERAVYVLRRYGHFQYHEIAKLLDIKKGTVSTMISKARAKLYQELKDVMRYPDEEILKH